MNSRGLRCVDVFAVLRDGSRKLAFTGSVKNMIERHWLTIRPKPTERAMLEMLEWSDVDLPMIYPDRSSGIDRNAMPSLFLPTPVAYVAVGRPA